MEALAPVYISEEEFWALEERSDVKHEYFNGEIFAMSGGTNRHAVLCTNATIVLGTRLRGQRCRVVGSEQAVKIESNGMITYPDASVYCKAARFEGRGDLSLLDPVVIIEVLSRSTAAYDHGVKFRHYQQIASLQDYILVEQDQFVVEHYHRLENNHWLLNTLNSLDDELRLESINCTLPLREWYDGVEVPHGPPPLRLSED